MISIQKLFGKDDTFFNLLDASANEGRTSIQALNAVLSNPAQSASTESFHKIKVAVAVNVSQSQAHASVGAVQRMEIGGKREFTVAVVQIDEGAPAVGVEDEVLIPVTIEVDKQGQVARTYWVRAPAHAPEVIKEIEKTVRQAAPYPVPAHLGKVVYSDVWLWHKSGKFQLDTLTEGQD